MSGAGVQPSRSHCSIQNGQGVQRRRNIHFAEHSFGEWKTNAEGKRTKVCSACGKVANFMYGDLNYDGKVNAIDLTILRRYLARYSDKIDIAVADFNGDGKVNTLDLMLLRRFLVGYDSVLGK